MCECVEDVTTENVSRNWKAELEDLLDINYRLFDDLMSRGLIEFGDPVEDLEAQSSFLVQRGRLLDHLVNKLPTDVTQFLDALRTTGQEHVANYIKRKGCK